jgi:hypothetical protein
MLEHRQIVHVGASCETNNLEQRQIVHVGVVARDSGQSIQTDESQLRSCDSFSYLDSLKKN